MRYPLTKPRPTPPTVHSRRDDSYRKAIDEVDHILEQMQGLETEEAMQVGVRGARFPLRPPPSSLTNPTPPPHPPRRRD